MIVFTRVDDRVIHGQTMVMWLSEFTCNGIIIIDDELAGNQVMAEIYKNAVSANIKVFVFDLDTAVRRLDEIHNSAKKYILIFKSAGTLRRMVEKCQLPITQVNVGPSSKRPNTVEIVPTIALDESEIEAYRKIVETGLQVYFQIIPTVRKVWWDDLVKKNIV